MQCPRCGLQNLPDITACARCGLPVRQGPQSASNPGASAPATPVGGSAGGSAPPSGGYGPASYGPPPGYGAPPQQLQQPSYAQPAPASTQAATPPPYASPYATAVGSPYSTGPIAPYGSTTLLPVTPRSGSDGRDKTAGLVRLILLIGVLASAGYAIWAMSARRGIFADFADNRPVSLDDAKTSDRLDTVFLVVAGAIAVIALALWLARLLSGRARSGALTVVGLVISGLGLVCVVVGLVMSGLVGNGGDRAAEGRDALTATVVTGSGFIALAVGLVIGCLVIGRSRSAAAAAADGRTPALSSDDAAVGPAGW